MPTKSAPRSSCGPLYLTLPALAVLALVMAVPLGVIVLRSFIEPEPGLANYVWFFQTNVNITVLLRTFSNPMDNRTRLITPESCNKITHANVRTTPDTQNGTNTHMISASRRRGPATDIAKA